MEPLSRSSRCFFDLNFSRLTDSDSEDLRETDSEKCFPRPRTLSERIDRQITSFAGLA